MMRAAARTRVRRVIITSENFAMDCFGSKTGLINDEHWLEDLDLVHGGYTAMKVVSDHFKLASRLHECTEIAKTCSSHTLMPGSSVGLSYAFMDPHNQSACEQWNKHPAHPVSARVLDLPNDLRSFFL